MLSFIDYGVDLRWLCTPKLPTIITDLALCGLHICHGGPLGLDIILSVEKLVDCGLRDRAFGGWLSW